jgi:predicted esterase
VATHGAGGTPEAECAFWRDLVGGTAFVLCPRGVTMDVYAPPEDRGYFYPAHPALGREVRAALAALDARFPDRVDREGAVYAGFSQGATMGTLVFASAPAPFAAVVLIEGGVDEWTVRSARHFKEGGGKRVLFACGRRSCADAARRSAGYLTRAGVESRVVDASGAGHTYGGAVREGLAAALPFVFGGDARWR